MAGAFLKRKVAKAYRETVSWFQSVPSKWLSWLFRKRDVTIISNNCWAGKAYQYLHKPYLSPTVGLFFFAEDYLKFVVNLHYYLGVELVFISPSQSRFAVELKDRNMLNVPVGILDDVEIIFLHYHSETEAKEKWDRRKERVNYEDLIIKFSSMNLCTEEHLQRFDALPYGAKFFLHNRRKPVLASEVYWNGRSNENGVLDDTTGFPGNLSLRRLLHRRPCGYPKEGLLVSLDKVRE